MLRTNVPQGIAPRSRGSELLIGYSGNRRNRKRDRTVVFIGRSAPPVTSAEIEIMFDHLESSFAKQMDAAGNDNG